MRIKKLFSWILLCSIPTLTAAAQKQASSTNKSLSSLRARAGDGPWDLWKTEPLHRRLLALLGKDEFEALRLNMDPAEPMAISNGIMSSIGLREHMGTEEEGALIIDLDHDVLEVLILHDGKTVSAWAEHNQYIPLPAKLLEQIQQRWPQPALKQALMKLQQTSAKPPRSSSPQAPVPSTSSSSALGL
ncbi:MAG: hypothetical protein PW789_03800 [Edaphobacter sp.]|uniref:hypothetical protein n=1 Tax=Edaphobacter sp. TaxID=1934404 RepID=UPI002399CFAB|nr:hypothetical protein [Edaphobacter sp.]MDE1175709.1 hypothetical protein [Edaphobacter sp.]